MLKLAKVKIYIHKNHLLKMLKVGKAALFANGFANFNFVNC